MSCCSCCLPNKTGAIVGIVLGILFLILSCVYNFQTFGFVLSIACFTASGAYLGFVIKEAR